MIDDFPKRRDVYEIPTFMLLRNPMTTTVCYSSRASEYLCRKAWDLVRNTALDMMFIRHV